MSTLLLPGGASLLYPGGGLALLPSVSVTTYTGTRTLKDANGRVLRVLEARAGETTTHTVYPYVDGVAADTSAATCSWVAQWAGASPARELITGSATGGIESVEITITLDEDAADGDRLAQYEWWLRADGYTWPTAPNEFLVTLLVFPPVPPA